MQDIDYSNDKIIICLISVLCIYMFALAHVFWYVCVCVQNLLGMYMFVCECLHVLFHELCMCVNLYLDVYNYTHIHNYDIFR